MPDLQMVKNYPFMARNLSNILHKKKKKKSGINHERKKLWHLGNGRPNIREQRQPQQSCPVSLEFNYPQWEHRTGF